MKIPTISIKKLPVTLFKGSLNRINALFKFDYHINRYVMNEWMESESIKDKPQFLYSNQINIEQL